MPQSLRIKSDIDHSLCPGAIGVFVHRATEQAQSGSTSVSTSGWLPVFVMEYCYRYRMFPFNLSESYVSVLEVKRGCATAVNAVAASAYKVIKLRFIYIVSKLAAQM